MAPSAGCPIQALAPFFLRTQRTGLSFFFLGTPRKHQARDEEQDPQVVIINSPMSEAGVRTYA